MHTVELHVGSLSFLLQIAALYDSISFSTLNAEPQILAAGVCQRAQQTASVQSGALILLSMLIALHTPRPPSFYACSVPWEGDSWDHALALPCPLTSPWVGTTEASSGSSRGDWVGAGAFLHPAWPPSLGS